MKVSLGPITEADIAELLENLLPEDREEILAMGFEVEWGVRNTVETSIESMAIRGDGKLACLVGLCESSILAPRIYPWMLATEVAVIDKKNNLRISRDLIRLWTSEHPYMTNWVDQRHTRAVEWLKWLGAKLTPTTFGPYRRPFYKFEFGEP